MSITSEDYEYRRVPLLIELTMALTNKKDSPQERMLWAVELLLRRAKEKLQRQRRDKAARILSAFEEIVDNIRMRSVKEAAWLFWRNYTTPSHYIDTGVPIGRYADPVHRMSAAIEEVTKQYVEHEFIPMATGQYGKRCSTEEARQWILSRTLENLKADHPECADAYHKSEADVLSAYLWFTSSMRAVEYNHADVHQAWQTVAEWRLSFDAPVFWPGESDLRDLLTEDTQVKADWHSYEHINVMMCQRIVRHLNSLWT